MIIRSFVAESVATALKQVRSEMGGDAVVLKTRQLDGKGNDGRFEVTACLDKPTAYQATRTLPDRRATVAEAIDTDGEIVTTTVADEMADASVVEKRLHALDEKLESLLQIEQLAGSGFEDELRLLEESRRALVTSDIPTILVNRFLSGLKDRDPQERLTAELIESRLTTLVKNSIDTELTFKAGDRVLFVGPAGAGKTSAIGKLAARLVMKQKLAVKLITVDNSNIGAYDEIASYAELLGVAVTNPSFATEENSDTDDSDKVVLIDTGSLPTEAKELKIFSTEIEKLKPTHRLAVFSATTRSSDIQTFAAALKPLEAGHLVFTMTDLTDFWGGMLAASEATGLKIALTAQSPSGVGSLDQPDISTVVSKLLGREVGHE